MSKMIFAGFMQAAKEDRVANEEREEKRKALEEDRKFRMEEAAKGRDFQRELTDDQQSFSARQSERQNAFTAGQNAIDRSASEQNIATQHSNAVNLRELDATITQGQEDTAFERQVDAAMTLYGDRIDPSMKPQVAAGIRQLGDEGFNEAMRNGDFVFKTETPKSVSLPLNAEKDPSTGPLFDVTVAPKGVEYTFGMGPLRPEMPNQEILNSIGYAAKDVVGEGVRVIITSGKGEHGSHRHRDGHAADVEFVDTEGNKLTLDDPRAAMLADRLGQFGITGFGAGEKYMGNTTFHMDNYPLERYTADMGQRWGEFGKKFQPGKSTNSGNPPAMSVPRPPQNAEMVYAPQKSRDNMFYDGWPDDLGAANSPEKAAALRQKIIGSIPRSDPMYTFYVSQAESAMDVQKALAEASESVPSLADDLRGLDSLDKAIPYLNTIDIDTSLSEEEREVAVLKTREIISSLYERDITDAKAKGDRIPFVRYGGDGSLDRTRQVMVTYQPPDENGEGEGYVDVNGNTIDANAGVVIPPNASDKYIEVHNTTIREASEKLESGGAAISALLRVRSMAIENPKLTNDWTQLVADGGKTLEAAANAFGNFTGDPEEDYKRFEGVIGQVIDSGDGNAAFKSALLRAAYTMAAAKGSSGQALSDNELKLNLNSLGNGIADPEEFIKLNNGLIREVLGDTQQAISTKLGNMAGTDFDKAQFMQSTLFSTPVDELFGSQFEMRAKYEPELLEGYNDALAGVYQYDNVSSEPMGSPDLSEGQKRLDSILNGGVDDTSVESEISDELTRAVNEPAQSTTQSAPVEQASTENAGPKIMPAQRGRDDVDYIASSDPIYVDEAEAEATPALRQYVGKTVTINEFANNEWEIEVVQ